MRLLIVEDEKQICDMVAKSLYAAGYEVDTCYDGKEALECILSENYDLIVLDLNLPGMDGMELLKELRKYNDETKVLILSARGQIADKVEGLDAGANDYMEKPFHLQELEARIRSLTRRKFVQNDICLKCALFIGKLSSAFLSLILLLSLHSLIEINKMSVELRSVNTCELNLSVHDQTACSTHTCSINHDWVH